MFKVPLTKILALSPHPNPVVERLEVATVYGYNVIVKKGSYQVGDTVLYIPIDSVLPKELEDTLFPPDAKIKLNNSRVRQTRIQKFPSQGMLMSSSDLMKFLNVSELPELETDLASELKIEKYEPPAPSWQGSRISSVKRTLENPLFNKYKGLENIKWFPDMFKEGEMVVMQEKLHGSNIRAALLPATIAGKRELFALIKEFFTGKAKSNTLKTILYNVKKMILSKFGAAPDFELCYGSNNVELTNRSGYKGFYDEDVYGNVLKAVEAAKKLKPFETIFGELIGPGIQKGYTYGHDKHHFVLFDVMIRKDDGSVYWLSPDEVVAYGKERGFDVVPVVYDGPFNKELAHSLTKGPSVYCPKEKVREGIVIKAKVNYSDIRCPNGRKSLKWISEEYLDKNNTDFH